MPPPLSLSPPPPAVKAPQRAGRRREAAAQETSWQEIQPRLPMQSWANQLPSPTLSCTIRASCHCSYISFLLVGRNPFPRLSEKAISFPAPPPAGLSSSVVCPHGQRGGQAPTSCPPKVPPPAAILPHGRNSTYVGNSSPSPHT